jgi:Papain-like cysteine protease AvrRpt2
MADVLYLVAPIKQVTRMSCVPTAIWMMHRWYLDRTGQSFQIPIFDAYVSAAKGLVDDGGLAEKNIAEFVRQHDLESDSIGISPESFQSQLERRGPFVYIETIPAERLPTDLLLRNLGGGTHFSHVLLITGIKTKDGFSTLFYNDPGTGKSDSMEFFQFVTSDHRPLRGLGKSLIIFLKRKSLGS